MNNNLTAHPVEFCTADVRRAVVYEGHPPCLNLSPVRGYIRDPGKSWASAYAALWDACKLEARKRRADGQAAIRAAIATAFPKLT